MVLAGIFQLSGGPQKFVKGSSSLELEPIY